MKKPNVKKHYECSGRDHILARELTRIEKIREDYWLTYLYVNDAYRQIAKSSSKKRAIWHCWQAITTLTESLLEDVIDLKGVEAFNLNLLKEVIDVLSQRYDADITPNNLIQYLEDLTCEPPEENSEYVWPCEPYKATEYWDGLNWVPVGTTLTSKQISWNHRRPKHDIAGSV